jgi:type II secretory pathway predicted ATPase ExeA
MYKSFYGLQVKPFENTPDPDFVFLSNQHREALSSLLYGIENAKGFILITGSVGTGKTTIIRTFLQQTHPEHIIINVINPKTSFTDVLDLLAEKLAIKRAGVNQLVWLELLQERLCELNKREIRALILVDEAHLLREEALEEIRLLSNIEHEKQKLIQIVLVGQNEIYELLARERQKSLQQRIVISRQLSPLNKKETSQYIEHRLRVAGCSRIIFGKDALKLIWRQSQGVPRLINHLCDNALLIGYAMSAAAIGKKIIKEVIHDMGVERRFLPPSNWRLHTKTGWLTASIILLVALMFWYGKLSYLPVSVQARDGVASVSSTGHSTKEAWLVPRELPKPVADKISRNDRQGPLSDTASPTKIADVEKVEPENNGQSGKPLVTLRAPVVAVKMLDTGEETPLAPKPLAIPAAPKLLYPGVIKIKPQERLGDIAKRAYGIYSETVIDFLQQANHIRDVDKIYSGRTMRLPLITPDSLVRQTDNGHFHILYASFYANTSAIAVRRGLQAEGRNAYIESSPQSPQGIRRVYRVYIGYFTNRAAAAKALQGIDLKYLSFLKRG